MQAATDGTIFTMKKSMDQVEQILREAGEQLAIAEQKADEQADKHKELTDLAARSDNLLDTIRTRSEEVRCKKLWPTFWRLINGLLIASGAKLETRTLLELFEARHQCGKLFWLKTFQVQMQAEQAKETADRARQQINDSLKLIADLKNRLQVVQSNDVKVVSRQKCDT